MVETITPVVHGGSRSRWGISLALHAIAAAVAAAIVGSLLAGAGALLGAPWGVPGATLVVAAAAMYVVRERPAAPRLGRARTVRPCPRVGSGPRVRRAFAQRRGGPRRAPRPFRVEAPLAGRERPRALGGARGDRPR